MRGVGGGRSRWEVRRSEAAVGVTREAPEGGASLGSEGSEEERKSCRSERGGLVQGPGVCKGQRRGSRDKGPGRMVGGRVWEGKVQSACGSERKHSPHAEKGK